LQIAIASGKGGTGKTTVALNLALVASLRGQPVCLLDCDVEEPNCHLFLRPVLGPPEDVRLPVPELVAGKCDGCGECARLCRYKAIMSLPGTALIFPEMCHGCGGCLLVCPRAALREGSRTLGWRQRGAAGDLAFAMGRLRVGEAMASPLIRRVRKLAQEDALNIIDAPPGTACPVIAAVEGADYVVLVAEPTPFGLNDLELAAAMVRALGLPCGVVINRADVGDGRVEDFCRREGLPVLGRLPFDPGLAAAYARGELAVSALPAYGRLFEGLLERVLSAASRPEAA
jgi:MinD superfamily P-loop ATPase